MKNQEWEISTIVIIIKVEKDSMIKAGHAIEIEVIIGTIRILEAGTLGDRNIGKYDKGSEVNFKDRDKLYDRGRSRDKYNRGRSSRNRRDSRSRYKDISMSRYKSEERRCHYSREPNSL